MCPANYYCPGGAATAVPCPLNTASPAGAAVATACLAVAGFYGAPGQAAVACPLGTMSLAKATTINDCAPVLGYYGVSGGQMLPCPEVLHANSHSSVFLLFFPLCLLCHGSHLGYGSERINLK